MCLSHSSPLTTVNPIPSVEPYPSTRCVGPTKSIHLRFSQGAHEPPEWNRSSMLLRLSTSTPSSDGRRSDRTAPRDAYRIDPNGTKKMARCDTAARPRVEPNLA